MTHAQGPPSPVVTATAYDAQIGLTWTFTPTTTYSIQRKTGAGGTYATIVTGLTVKNYMDTSNLANGTTYYYIVTGASYPPAAAVSATPLATITVPAPTGVVAAAGNKQVTITWSAAGGATSYAVKRSTTSGSGYTVVETATPYLTYTDTGLTNGTSYYYVVSGSSAHSTSGNSSQASAAPVFTAYRPQWAAGKDATTGFATATALVDGYTDDAGTYYSSTGTSAAVTALYDLGVSPPIISSAHVTAGTTSVPGTTYVQYSFDNSTWTTVGSASSAVGKRATAIFPSIAITPAPRYWRAVVYNGAPTTYTATMSDFRLFDQNGNNILYLPSAPTDLTATESSGQVVLNWEAMPLATSYNIYRGGSLYHSGTTGTTYTDTGVTNGTNYSYYVKSVDADGTGDASNTVTATPGTTALAAPTGLATNLSACNEIDLTWTAVSGAATYNVYRSTNSGGEGSAPYIAVVTGTSWQDMQALPGVNYYYKLTAVNGTAGESPISSEASAIAFTAFATSPTSLTIARGKTSAVNVVVTMAQCGVVSQGLVSLNLTNVPSGVTYWASDNPVAANGSYLYFCIDPGATTGTYSMTLTGTEGSVSRNQTISLTIN